jgi:hypothetical protein
MVSAGQLQLQQQELSHNLKYMACGRISEFESSHPSQGVGSLRIFPMTSRAMPSRICRSPDSRLRPFPTLYHWDLHPQSGRRARMTKLGEKVPTRVAYLPDGGLGGWGVRRAFTGS